MERIPARQAGGHWFEPSTAHSQRPWKQGLSVPRDENAFRGVASKWPHSRLGLERGAIDDRERADEQSRPVPRFLLRDAETGDAAGEFRVSSPVWGLGDVFVTGDGRRLRIVDMLDPPPERDDVDGLWLVEPVEPVFTDQSPAAPDAAL